MTGEGLAQLAAELEKKPGVDMVAPFGTSLHVSGRDRAALEAAIAPYRNDPKLIWTADRASLEDVFIDLMAQAKDNLPMSALRRSSRRRLLAAHRRDDPIKEFMQLRRDRISFAMIVMMPLMQLLLFGYAINTTAAQPADRGAAAGIERSRPLDPQGAGEHQIFQDHASGARRGRVRPRCWRPARCCSRSKFRAASSARCGAATGRRCWSPPTPPIRSRPAPALGALNNLLPTALRNDRAVPDSGAPPFEIRTHARYNPAGSSQLNIVPGLIGTILTMTMLIFTALSVTREIERGTMESLLAMPITPVEIMLGKIVPYVLVGFLQAALIVGAGIVLFGVPIFGSLMLLALLSTLFIATNLSIGYTFSTVAQNQLQAMQMSMMFFLPNILLSGFMFPFAGMPVWAQWIGECLPLTHYHPHRARDHAQGRDACPICTTTRWRWPA